MAIEYSDGTINTTFTNTTGTRREIVDGVVAALVSAGWTYKSGSGTGDVVLLSVATSSGNRMALRCYDPGSGNCAQLKLQSSDGLALQTGSIFLLPGVGKVWRVIASKYQFFVFRDGSITNREFAMGSALAIPSFMQSYQTTAAFVSGPCKTDSDSTFTVSFTRFLFTSWHTGYNFQSNGAYLSNAGMWETSNYSNSSSPGTPQMFTPSGVYAISGDSSSMPSRYSNGAWHISDPLVAWGTSSVAEEPTIKGQLWDAIVVHAALPGDTTYSFDGKTFWNITMNNPLTNHSLLLRIP